VSALKSKGEVIANTTLDVVGIGNAIVDVIAMADDAFIDLHGMTKGAMTLIDEERAERIYAAVGPGAAVSSGGSAGNTVAWLAELGSAAGYIGKVRDDELGNAFRKEISATGAVFRTPVANSGPATARCLIVVTPDSQRTMNTYLGACVNLGVADIDADADLIGSAQITHLEGYLYDEPHAKEAFHKAADIAHGAGRKVSLSLSDRFCVDRHHSDFLRLVEHRVDVLFANRAEIQALFKRDTIPEAVAHIRSMTELAVITLDAEGSVIVSQEAVIEIKPVPTNVVDTTGAGDAYAAGFLHALTRGRALQECGDMASAMAGEVISHVGARRQTAKK
jgi:sugar/nucleoside kinase (ribokinase family)